ncbi:Putative transcription regulator, LysR family [Cupriavidus taiwanensis]|uniref:Transcription regulator, LysR family n=1 Tax=Cupriavidus taiwanensis TaxID=164546 RepID=A0A375E543_9BURK|nr:LysR family transcriptional regulator [Cupriavidus taiwanensis]SOZ55847.1 Putative transcription regulator, LysR family [Cupriavidus taiwanensis]SOZ57292.1 Putative transcription regulator, LysR family [Cupriavidus taiwanensis]SOZ59704.1 Putative transcription regulator, LysR family [Cupriavidus taiwanensis]SPA05795.1 Putative transcription regulator, LysR family [Cupriavidus taiwanensis]
MRGFDTDQLRTFVTVADSGSLSAAAPRLFLSQSSVSEQLRKLEERAGVPLLTRGRHGAQPTPAGQRLLAHARRILDLNELALQELRGHALEGELRLAVTDYFRPGEIAGMLRRLRERYPYLRLHVTVMKSAAIDAAGERDTFDIGLSMRLPGTRATAARGLVLRREPLAWVAAPAEADSLPATLPLVLLPDTCSLHQYVVQRLLRKRVPYEIAHSASGVAGLHLALAAGLGVSCLNASAIGPGVVPLDAATVARLGLPRLPEAEFFLLPARRGESAFIAEARDALAAQLA